MFVSEMNLQLVNIIGEMLANLADFGPFVSVSPIIEYYTVLNTNSSPRNVPIEQSKTS